MTTGRVLALMLVAALCVLGRCGKPANPQNMPSSAGAATANGELRGLDFDTPFATLRARANAGNADAQWSLGVRCRFGVGVPADLERAREWLTRAAEADHAEACRALAWTCLAERVDRQTVGEATRWMNRAAELGNLDAMVEAADLPSRNPDYLEMARRYRAAAEKGAVAAQARYALLAWSGLVPSIDPTSAVAFAQQAADAGSPMAAEYVGTRLLLRQDGTSDPARGIEYLRFAARYGRPVAQNNVAQELQDPNDDFALSEEGLHWLSLAAEQNQEGALIRLSSMYERGLGLSEDPDKAAELTNSTIALSDHEKPPAFFQLSDAVISGFCVSNDGYLITSSPLLPKARQIQVLVAGSTRQAVIVRREHDGEVAMLKIVAQTRFIPLTSAPSKEPAHTLSFPAPWAEWRTPTVRDVGFAMEPTSSSASIRLDLRASNSGGAITDNDGRAIGVLMHSPEASAHASAITDAWDADGVTVTPAFLLDRGSPLLRGVDLDGTQPTDPKAIGPVVVVLIEM